MPGRARRMNRRRAVVGTAATAAVFAGTAGAVQHHQQKKWANKDQQAAYEAQQAQQAPQAVYEPEPEPEYYDQPPEEDVITQLERLGALKAQGILTEEEFAAQKAKLLNM